MSGQFLAGLLVGAVIVATVAFLVGFLAVRRARRTGSRPDQGSGPRPQNQGRF